MLKRLDPSELDGQTQRSLERALSASLSYVNDAEPGLRRRKAGKSFAYIDIKGRRIVDAATIDRLNALAIPPAWSDVWISPDPLGHIQATGRDLRGRKQYRYHSGWAVCRDDAKFSSLLDFADALPDLRERIDADLRRRGLPFEKVVASIIWLMDNTLIRVGNPAYARDNKSFGLTTLRRRHVTVEGATLRFSFIGKSGKEWRVRLVDRRMARIVRSIQELRGQDLFVYVDEDGTKRPVRSHDVNAYIRDACGPGFTSKHFRTWAATVRAAVLFGQTAVPDSKTATKRELNAMIDKVANRLGNTRAVCRACYIHPLVIETWLDGRLNRELARTAKSLRQLPRGLDEEEALVGVWLKSATRRKARAVAAKP